MIVKAKLVEITGPDSREFSDLLDQIGILNFDYGRKFGQNTRIPGCGDCRQNKKKKEHQANCEEYSRQYIHLSGSCTLIFGCAMYENWKQGITYGELFMPDWYRENLIIHDNGWGAIQISVLHQNNEFRGTSTMFAAIHYLTSGKVLPDDCQFTSKQAFDAAIAMGL